MEHAQNISFSFMYNTHASMLIMRQIYANKVQVGSLCWALLFIPNATRHHQHRQQITSTSVTTEEQRKRQYLINNIKYGSELMWNWETVRISLLLCMQIAKVVERIRADGPGKWDGLCQAVRYRSRVICQQRVHARISCDMRCYCGCCRYVMYAYLVHIL